ncbi:MAG: hypothetical protein GF411_04540 [Candidatus Lokiarchaeota archaeon]|nr:hypothetical protein [Candidatus Lokiarchaeota archaeon]
MSDEEVGKEIDEYIQSVEKLLPGNFETIDLLEDLRAHIVESYNDKLSQMPTKDKRIIISTVLQDLGSPKEIAEEYKKERAKEESPIAERKSVGYIAARITISAVVILLASYILHHLTDGNIDFFFAAIVMSFFVVLEFIVRGWLTEERRVSR